MSIFRRRMLYAHANLTGGGGSLLPIVPSIGNYSSGAHDGLSTTTENFTSINIGTPTATRLVVVGVGSYMTGNVGTFSSVVVGSTSLTRYGGTAGAGGTLPTDIWYGVVNAGTTVTIAVTNTFTMANCVMGCAVLDGVNPTPTGTIGLLDANNSQASPYLLGSALTVPSTGFGVMFVFHYNTTVLSYSNMTDDSQAHGTTTTGAISHTTSTVTPSVTAPSFQVVEMVGATWGP